MTRKVVARGRFELDVAIPKMVEQLSACMGVGLMIDPQVEDNNLDNCAEVVEESSALDEYAASHDFSQMLIKAVPRLNESFLSLSETIKSIVYPRISIPKEFFDSYLSLQQSLCGSVKSASTFSSDLMKALGSIASLVSEIADRVDWGALKDSFEGFDWEQCRIGAIRWGEYGWSISWLPLASIGNPPATLKEADSFYSNILTDDAMADLFGDLRQIVRRKRDLQECIELYGQRHYKPCAMMLCSLIEGQLTLAMPKGPKKRSGKVHIARD